MVVGENSFPVISRPPTFSFSTIPGGNQNSLPPPHRHRTNAHPATRPTEHYSEYTSFNEWTLTVRLAAMRFQTTWHVVIARAGVILSNSRYHIFFQKILQTTVKKEHKIHFLDFYRPFHNIWQCLRPFKKRNKSFIDYSNKLYTNQLCFRHILLEWNQLHHNTKPFILGYFVKLSALQIF